MGQDDDKLTELLERAKNYGISVEFDSGLLILKQVPTDDPVRQRESIEELGKYLVQIRGVAERHAIDARAKAYLGHPIWLPDYGEGKLTDGNDSGNVRVLVRHPRSQRVQTLTAAAKDLLIVVKVDPVPSDGEPIPEVPRRRLFGLIEFPPPKR
jgi:hypothetical protein